MQAPIQRQNVTALALDNVYTIKIISERFDNKRKYQLQFSKKQAELKRATKKAKRNSFRNTRSKITGPYGLPYKVVVKNKRTPAEILKQLGNPSSGNTKSFALKILQELYSPSQSPVSPPNCFPAIQEPRITKIKERQKEY
ncbi:hypothetical protein AVEN_148234-1 [Araneus ventricosus]|uniref:Uncharacterized protein n=1 Tax=Araneus ventricosus TaxID=182803 RepID=A0A4Y2IEL0_ARAVE|nr:hypothetical protein AVEN_148234-1 [Araneus ventricosus]